MSQSLHKKIFCSLKESKLSYHRNPYVSIWVFFFFFKTGTQISPPFNTRKLIFIDTVFLLVPAEIQVSGNERGKVNLQQSYTS